MGDERESRGAKAFTRAQGMWLGVAIIVAGLVMATVVPYLSASWAADRNAAGVGIEGELLDLPARRHPNASTSDYFAVYTYEADGQVRCQSGDVLPAGASPAAFCAEKDWIEISEATRDSISDRAYRASTEGQPIALRLDPDDATRARPEVAPRIGFFVRMGLIIAAVGAFVCWVAWNYAPGSGARAKG